MGCCLTSQHRVAKDIMIHSKVGDTVILDGDKVVLSSRGCCMGTLYTTDNFLHYVSRLRGVEHCFMRSKKRFRLSKIARVEVIQDKLVQYRDSKCIRLSPGLKISVDTNTTLWIAMHEAESFASELVKVTGGTTATLITERPNYFYTIFCLN